MLSREHALRATAELVRIAFVGDSKTPYPHAVDALDSCGQLVPPRHVIARARRQHVDLGVAGEMLGDVARVQFGAAVDRLAVPLNDDGELHCSSESKPRSDVEGAAGSDGGATPPPGLDSIEAGSKAVDGWAGAGASCVSASGDAVLCG